MDNTLLDGLNALAESAFPKQCRTCGREYATVEEYCKDTRPISETRSGLKQSEDDDGKLIVELFRNCPCGSTLMDCFSDRRDTSERGMQRRARFAELLGYLEKEGLERATAREELLKVMHGQGSDILKKYRTPD